ncbi:hypothetical protein GCM10007416_33820 [Kroppenstedtia guangzhouensis]|uniref:Uncharacterized protein n=2 Tax=Kroppenstedtia guangzhouensis TaxID=1274356 RepID=A0ABQ1H5A5_9BACL|nr:hypothetical protein GCM10007416_33820 [Kroppenstedtia guangzhouensis]
MQKSSFIQSGKKAREELYLPPLRFVVTDNWVDVLGHDAFIAWLKFHTWVDRRDENRENDRVPYSLEDVWTKLGMKKKKFYEKIARPLWEYGLIDIVEYEESNRKSQKPKNIIVYTSPANTHETETKPLEKLRDWSKDYGSISQFYGKKGGRPKKDDHGFQMETVEKDGFQTETVHGFQMETVTVSKRKPNNVSNISNNVLNNLINAENNNNPDRSGGTQTKTEKQKSIVVDVQSAWKESFKTDLPVSKARLFLKDANQDVNTVLDAIKAAAKKKPDNPIGAVVYGIKYGWDEVPEKKQPDKPYRSGSQNNDDLRPPRAVAEAIEREAKGEKVPDGEVDPETEARLRAKLNRMRERLGQRQKLPIN